MVRYQDGQRSRTRSQVIAAAIRTIWTDGTRAIGVGQVMASAGLTHGGFYRHFASKTELIDSAVNELLNACLRHFESRTRNLNVDDGLRSYINFCLSPGRRDAWETGCPLPVLVGDVPGLSETTRAKYASTIGRLIALIAASASRRVEDSPRRVATSVLMEMIGAAAVARSLPDDQACEVLNACRSSILQRLGLSRAASGGSDADSVEPNEAVTANGERLATGVASQRQGAPRP